MTLLQDQPCRLSGAEVSRFHAPYHADADNDVQFKHALNSAIQERHSAYKEKKERKRSRLDEKDATDRRSLPSCSVKSPRRWKYARMAVELCQDDSRVALSADVSQALLSQSGLSLLKRSTDVV